MIYKEVEGRLGNQLFQYATVKAYKKKFDLNDTIYLDFSKVIKKYGINDYNQLKFFNINDYKEINKNPSSFLQKIIFSIYKINYLFIKIISFNKNYFIRKYKYEKIVQPILNRNGLYCFTNGYYDFPLSKSKVKYFRGFFESSKYFNNIRDDLIEEITPKYRKLKSNKSLYNIIEKNNSVCISIRRGDFITNEKYNKKYYVCDENYFEEAIKIIKKRVKNPYFIVFSDDIFWCKENLKFPKNTFFEKGDDPIWEKLRLMYSCKHFIISNSTFSWWAQYLSQNNNKIVVAPSKWGNISYKKNDKIDIFENNWIFVER